MVTGHHGCQFLAPGRIIGAVWCAISSSSYVLSGLSLLGGTGSLGDFCLLNGHCVFIEKGWEVNNLKMTFKLDRRVFVMNERFQVNNLI